MVHLMGPIRPCGHLRPELKQCKADARTGGMNFATTPMPRSPARTDGLPAGISGIADVEDGTQPDQTSTKREKVSFIETPQPLRKTAPGRGRS